MRHLLFTAQERQRPDKGDNHEIEKNIYDRRRTGIRNSRSRNEEII